VAAVQTKVCDDPASGDPGTGDDTSGAAAAVALFPRRQSSSNAEKTRVLFIFTT